MSAALWVPGLMAALFSALGTGAFRRYAIRRELLDHPTDRSSHTAPMPRGGGLAILVSFVITVLVLVSQPGVDEWRLWLALGGIIPTAIVGWIDDRSSLSASVRILAHLATGAAIVPLALSASIQPAAWVLALWWVFATVSAINVVNFMDGIDGIIALQAAVFAVHLAALSHTPQATAFNLALAGAAGGFLLWNWAPARIFMGDVGSGSLGALGMIGALLVLREPSAEFIPVFLPLAPLFTDATVTLLRRVARGDRLSEPHCEHLYQRLASGGWGHARVALLYGALAAAGSAAAQTASTGAWPAALGVFVALTITLGIILERRVRPPTRR